jgi:hypothetical protein
MRPALHDQAHELPTFEPLTGSRATPPERWIIADANNWNTGEASRPAIE